MKVAVSVNEDEMIASHLGKCTTFCVFLKEGDKVTFLEMRDSAGAGKENILEALQGCEVVISGQIGAGMVENLKQAGIEAVIEKSTEDPLQAVKNL